MHLQTNTSFTDRDGALDAVVRMLEGIDYGNEALLRAVFTDDAVFDLSEVHPTVGVYGVYEGKEMVVTRLMETVGSHMDTMHAMSNARVEIRVDEAKVTCYIIGQHFLAGQGPSLEFENYLLLGNRLELEVVRDHDQIWQVRRNKVIGRWAAKTPVSAP
jgi:SnoaL-like domain